MLSLLLLIIIVYTAVAIETECYLNSTGIGTLISVLHLDGDCALNFSALGTLDLTSHFNSDCFSYDNNTNLDNMYVTKVDNTFLFIPIFLLLASQFYLVFQITKMSTCAFKTQHVDIYANINK
jgi:hypothetical protein